MHRFVWDLTETPPLSATHGYPISAVPHDTPRGPQGVRVLPGAYRVRLTVDGTTLTAPFTVVMDPRSKLPPDALRQQVDLLRQLSARLTEGSRALRQARSVNEQLTSLEGRAKGAIAKALGGLEKEVTELLEADAPTRTPGPVATLRAAVGEVLALYGSVGQADAAPTPAQLHAAKALSRSLSARVNLWQSIVKDRVPALNRQLERSGPPPRSCGRPVAGGGGDEPGPGVAGNPPPHPRSPHPARQWGPLPGSRCRRDPRPPTSLLIAKAVAGPASGA